MKNSANSAILILITFIICCSSILQQVDSSTSSLSRTSTTTSVGNSDEFQSLKKSQFNTQRDQSQKQKQQQQQQQQQRHGNLRKNLANHSNSSRRTAMVESDGIFDLMNCDSYDYVW